MADAKRHRDEDAARTTSQTAQRKPKPTSEEDLQTKDASEMPLEPQDPVKPPDPAS